LEIPLLSGRELNEMDRGDSPLVALVNQEFVRRNFPDGEALGQRIVLLGETREIVGVVANFIQRRIPFDGFIEPGVFLPAAQSPMRNISFVVRATGDPASLAPDVRRAVWKVDPDQPIAAVQTLEDFIRVELAAPAFLGLFVGALSGLAMFLSGIGIYGVMAHTVAQERREMGIRLAVGARGGQLVGMVARRGLFMSGFGLILGIPLAILIHRSVLNALGLFQAEMGPGVGLLSGGVLAVVALLASYLPARSAAGVEPTRALSLE
jgi:hypothetical protein